MSKKKEDFVDELHQEFFMARNALTRFEHSDGKAKAEHKELMDAMKAATKELSDKREALVKAVGKEKK
jgi:hypothetical protein